MSFHVENLSIYDNIETRRCIMRLYLATCTNTTYSIVMKSHKNKLLNIDLPTKRVQTPEQKYTIISVILNHLKKTFGTVDDQIKRQISSDLRKEDVAELVYYLYKAPPPPDCVDKMLSDYQSLYNDTYFTSSIILNTSSELHILVGANKTKTKLYGWYKNCLYVLNLGNSCKIYKSCINKHIQNNFILCNNTMKVALLKKHKNLKSIVNSLYFIHFKFNNIMDDDILHIDSCIIKVEVLNSYIQKIL